jgi:AmiR/NasT family two-component response regulator
VDTRRVVVTEDEALIRLDLVELLGECGYDVVGAASDGEAGIELVRRLRPDVAVFDVKLPGIDGISAAEQVADLVPVVLLTAFSQRELVDRAVAAGAMAYVVKPFGKADLVPALEVAMARFAQLRTLSAELGTALDQLAARKLVDRAKGLLMAGQGMSEPDAFRWLQKSAMDRRLPLAEVAEVVIRELGSGGAVVQ